MKVLIAPDKFKGSLTAEQVCDAIREGLLAFDPRAKVTCLPLADGGEGTGELLTKLSGGKNVEVTVSDPLFREITTGYGISGDGATAFVEMARASGLQLLHAGEKNPRNTTTLGTGQLIAHALDRGVKNIVLGIGGSATNDAGMGMAHALGYRFLSNEKKILPPVGNHLIHVDSIDIRDLHPRIASAKVTAIFDVKNPLYGVDGAAHVFASQKGASPSDIEYLDAGLRHFARKVYEHFHFDMNFKGAGAGGGMSGGAGVFLNASFSAGIDHILRESNVEQRIAEADLVITGEGKIDDQTLSGKVVQGIAALAKKHHKNCIAVAGSCTLAPDQVMTLGLREVLTLTSPLADPEMAMKHAYQLVRQRVFEFAQFHLLTYL